MHLYQSKGNRCWWNIFTTFIYVLLNHFIITNSKMCKGKKKNNRQISARNGRPSPSHTDCRFVPMRQSLCFNFSGAEKFCQENNRNIIIKLHFSNKRSEQIIDRRSWCRPWYLNSWVKDNDEKVLIPVSGIIRLPSGLQWRPIKDFVFVSKHFYRKLWILILVLVSIPGLSGRIARRIKTYINSRLIASLKFALNFNSWDYLDKSLW